MRQNSPTKRKQQRSTTRSVKSNRNNSIYFPLYDGPQYQQEVYKNFELAGSTQLVTTAGTAFLVNYPLGNVTSQIPDWTDISNMYDEYMLKEIRIEIMCLTPPTPGGARWFFNSIDPAFPTVNDAEDRTGVLMTNHSMNNNRVWRMKFLIKDFSLLSHRATSVDYVVGYFKGITNTANFGTSALNTLLYQFRAYYRFSVRGKKA